MTTLHNLLFKITLGEIDRWISENGTDSGTSQGYKFREADKLEKFLNVMENMNIPYPMEDFDVLNGTEKEHWFEIRESEHCGTLVIWRIENISV